MTIIPKYRDDKSYNISILFLSPFDFLLLFRVSDNVATTIQFDTLSSITRKILILSLQILNFSYKFHDVDGHHVFSTRITDL